MKGLRGHPLEIPNQAGKANSFGFFNQIISGHKAMLFLSLIHAPKKLMVRRH